MDRDSLTYKTLRNFSYNLFSFGFPLIFAIFITPIIVFSLGTRDYGVFIFINTIISLLGLLDLGISTAAQKYISEYFAKKDFLRLRNLIGTMNSLFLAIGLLGFLISSLIGLIGCNYFNCSADTTFSYPFLFLIAGLIFLVECINSVYNITPSALQRFDVSTKISVLKTTLQQLTILGLVLSGFSLYSIFITILLYSIVFSFISRFASLRILPEANLFFSFSMEQAKKVYTFGLSIVVNSLSSSALVHVDRFLIPILLGPSKLTYYTLPGNISSKVPGITGSISSVIFPLTTHIHSLGDQEQLKRMYLRSLNLITISAAAMSVPILIFSHEILRFWLDESFARESGAILMIFSGIAFLVSLQSHVSNFLYGMGKIKAITGASVLMALLNLALLLILLPKFGIIGAAWAYLISLLPIYYLYYYVEKKYLHMQHSAQRYTKMYAKILCTSVILYMISYVVLIPLTTSFLILLFVGPFSVALFLTLFYLFGFFEKEDIVILKNYAHSSFNGLIFRSKKE